MAQRQRFRDMSLRLPASLVRVGEVDGGLSLAFTRACAVCGLVLQQSHPVWRIFSQAGAAVRRLNPENSFETVGPGHLSCMLYSAQVCPYWSNRNARLGKDSTSAPGAPRGTLAAVLGYSGYLLVVPVNASFDLPQFLFLRLCGDIKFREPSELMERYLAELESEVLPDGPRSYWTDSREDRKRLFAVLSRGVIAVRQREPVIPEAEVPDGRVFAGSSCRSLRCS